MPAKVVKAFLFPMLGQQVAFKVRVKGGKGKRVLYIVKSCKTNLQVGQFIYRTENV
jgi:hypothetical protein